MRIGIVGLCVIFVSACYNAAARTPGLEGGACYPNGTCNAGLQCVEGECMGTDVIVPDGGVDLPDGSMISMGVDGGGNGTTDSGTSVPDGGFGYPHDSICPGHYGAVGNSIFLRLTDFDVTPFLENIDGVNDYGTRSTDRVPFDYPGGVENALGTMFADMTDGLSYASGGATLPVYMISMVDYSVASQGTFVTQPPPFWVRVSGLDTPVANINWSTFSDPCVRVAFSFDRSNSWDLSAKATVVNGHIRTIGRFHQLNENDIVGPLSQASYVFSASEEWLSVHTNRCNGGCSPATMLLRAYVKTMDITFDGTGPETAGTVRQMGYIKSGGNVNDPEDFAFQCNAFVVDANLSEIMAIPNFCGQYAHQYQTDMFIDETTHEILTFDHPNATDYPNAMSLTFVSNTFTTTTSSPF